MKRVVVLLITVALIVGLVGCPAGPQYSLTVSSTAGGAVTTPGEGIFAYGQGTAASLVATPDAGFRFVEWTGDVGTITDVRSRTTTIAMNGDYSVAANFVAVRNLTVTSSAGGSVTTPGEGTFVYDLGAVVSLVAAADEGYRFVGWTGDLSTIIDVNSASVTITVNGSYSIIANFAEVYELTVSSTEGGRVTTPGEGVFSYDPGTEVNLAASPARGYRFANWTGDAATIADVNAVSTTITMNGDSSITATFVAQYVLTVSSTAGGSVITPGEGLFTYDAGTVVSISAEAEKSHKFVGWTGDVHGVADAAAASTTVTMNNDCSVEAGFLEVTEVWDWYGLDAVRQDLSGDYLLMRDLDSTVAGYRELASSTANGGMGWEPIGDALWNGQGWVGDFFVGTFDGQGYEVRGLFINRPYELPELPLEPEPPRREWVGLFGSVGREGMVENVGIVEVYLTGGDGVGGLVGWNQGSVAGCHSAGRVRGQSNAGGLVGVNGGTVSNSYSSSDVAAGSMVGGLVAQSWGEVSNSHFTGRVSGQSGVGGLVGVGGGTVVNSYYNYDKVLINGQRVITTGALFDSDFDEWLANDKSFDVDERLYQEDGYYLINSVSDLKELLALGQDGSLRFRLTGDLDLVDAPNLYIPYLAGEFHGDGHRVFNLRLQLGATSRVGFFGYVANSGRVYRLGIDDLSVSGSSHVGGLAGANYGRVSTSYSTGHVYGASEVGGLVGWNHAGTIGESYSTASVMGGWSAGGLVGRNLAGIVSNTYSTGIVRGDDMVGGLIGVNEGTVSSSYSTGSVTGSDRVGGLVGADTYWGTGTATLSFWDVQTSGRTTSAGGMGRTTGQMKHTGTFSAAGWNITAVAVAERNTAYTWNIVDGQTYPFLSWQSVS